MYLIYYRDDYIAAASTQELAERTIAMIVQCAHDNNFGVHLFTEEEFRIAVSNYTPANSDLIVSDFDCQFAVDEFFS